VNVFLIETVAGPAEGGIHECAQAAAGCREEDDAEGSALLKRGLLTGDGGELAS
jgi:hypothetical protein